MFTPEVYQSLKYYVYRLIDPRNGETFYIGKGKGNRVFAHIREELDANDDVLSEKLQRIREIKRDGHEVGHVIHRHGMEEKIAFEVEAALIDAYPAVSNKMSGHYSDDFGVMHANQIVEKYRAVEADFRHHIILINVNQSATDNSTIYEAVQYAWKISPQKAAEAEFIMAVQQGLIIGVFIADQWLKATPENFPGRSAVPGRWGFKGRPAPQEIISLYSRKRIPESLRKRGASNPIRYTF